MLLLFNLLCVTPFLQQIVQCFLSIINVEVRGFNALEDGVYRRLQIVKEERLASRGKIFCQSLDDSGSRKIRTVNVRTVDHYRRRNASGASAVFVHQITHIVHRWEDQATIRCQH